MSNGRTSIPTLSIGSHGLRPMAGRDPHEGHRAATALELLFDLVFVIAFGVAGNQTAHLLAEGHYGSAISGFSFAMFAVIWAWINFTWFASAYDTDDWVYRVTTMIQMVGVVVLALGLPAMFASFDHHEGDLDNTAMVTGYVIMRVPMITQWLRAARQDPGRRRVCYTYIWTIAVAQIGWVCLLVFVSRPPATTFVIALPLFALELAGPWFAERRDGGTPWHPHHIAERYGLLAIIALGEVLVGTVASLSAAIEHHGGWTPEIALVALGGVGLTFGMWWIYFMVPAGEVLHHLRHKSFVWGYGHFPVYASIAAVGAGLHVAAYYIEDAAHIGATAVMLTMAIPLAIYFVTLGLLFGNLVGLHSHHTLLTCGKLAIAALSVILAAAGVPLTVCILVLALAPVLGIVAEELGGGRRREAEVAEVIG